MLRFLSSLQLAILLICAIAGISIGATLFDAREMFSTWLFRILIAGFFINLLLCTIRLLPALKKRFTETPLAVYEKGAGFPAVDMSWDEALHLLEKEHFHLRKMEVEGKHVFLAQKKRITLLAPYLLHLGLLVIILGAFATTFQASGDMRLAPGERMHLPEPVEARLGEGSLYLHDFETIYDDDGSISNWVSTFDLNIPQKLSREMASTEVNHPFKEKGLSIYQKAWETRHLVHLEGIDEAGDYALPEGIPLPLGDVFAEVQPMTQDIALLMLYNGKGQLLDQKALKKGEVISLAGDITMRYQEPLEYTVLNVKYNPFLPLVFLGFIIACGASLMFFFGRYTVVRGYQEDADEPLKLQIVSKDMDYKETLDSNFGLLERGE